MKIRTSIENLKNYQVCLKIEEAVHQFFKENHYLRLDLPILSPSLIPESYLEIFETHFDYLNNRSKLYLTPSPELFIKRLLTEGIGNCYYLGKAFRNSELPSRLHSPEFTILEFYKLGVDYLELADEVLDLLQYLAYKFFGKKDFIYQKKRVLLRKWEKFSVKEAFYRFAGIDELELFNHRLFFQKAKKKGYEVKNASYQDLWSQIYVQEVEPHLGKRGFPTLIYDYPKELAALAKLNPDKKTAQRFEFYIAGIELGDGYSELDDWQEQKERFLIEKKIRKENKKINHKIDWELINYLKKIFPSCSGVAIGFDRLAMIFADVSDISKLKLVNIT